MFNILFSLLVGVLAGTFTGLIPGIHINLISSIIITGILTTNFPINQVIVFIVAMAIAHTFIDFIPSIFLGAPNEDTALGVLPGHEFLIKGQGHQAVKLATIGSSIAILSLLIVLPIFIYIVPKIYPFIQRMLGFFLIWISILLIIPEKEKLKTIIIFTLSGFLGVTTFNLNIQQPLLPMLTGLFGASTIIHSIKSNAKIPEQKIQKLALEKKELIRPTISTIIVSPICSFFPGLGSSQAAVIGSKIIGNLNKEQFLILIGSINTLVMSTSFITLFLIQKSRTGAAAAISQLTTLTPKSLILILITIIITSIISVPLTIYLSKIFARSIHKINYTKISYIILATLTIITFIFTSYLGILIFLVSTIIGLTCIELNVKKSFLMGAILIPTIIYYLHF